MNEQRFDVGHGCNGCIAGGLCMVVFGFAMVAIPKGWIDFSLPGVDQGLYIVGWFVPVCVGGYVAARGGGTTSWTHALVVGVFAEFYVVHRLSKKDGELSEAFADLFGDPATHWFRLAQIAMTIPVALIGGAIAQSMHRRRNDESSDAAALDDGEQESGQ